MHKVISVNLNGNAYQLDDDAHLVLEAYLDRAEEALANNPDRTEVLADLEQAIAEKCNRVLGPQKTVVLKAEIEAIVLEMGPVDGGGVSSSPTPDDGAADSTGAATRRAPKRLYRIKEDAMIAGVCTGLAAFFGIDVTLVRVIFVVATFLTSGAAVLAYAAAMLLVPEANTSDEHAAAHGMPFNAREIVEQATKFTKGHQAWHRHWRRRRRRLRREWNREWKAATTEEPYWRSSYVPGAFFAAIMSPLFGLINGTLFVLFWIAIYTRATTGNVAGWTIPPGMPFWVAALILLVLLVVVTTPLSAARHISQRTYGQYPVYAVWSGIAWLGVVAGLIWLATGYEFEIRDFVSRLPSMWSDVWLALRER